MRTKNVLKGLRFYLSGAIEKSKDDGVSWRKRFTELAQEKNFKIKIADPTDKKDDVISEIGVERQRMRQLKASHEFEEVTAIMKKVRHWDLRACDYAHALIVCVDPNTPTWGTPDEVVMCERQKKPILAIINGGPANAPDWLLAIVDYNDIFESVELLIEHLEDLNSGKIPLDSKWVIIEDF